MHHTSSSSVLYCVPRHPKNWFVVVQAKLDSQDPTQILLCVLVLTLLLLQLFVLVVLELTTVSYTVATILHWPFTGHSTLILHEQPVSLLGLGMLSNFVSILGTQGKYTLKLCLLNIFLYLYDRVKCLCTNLRMILPTHVLIFSEKYCDSVTFYSCSIPVYVLCGLWTRWPLASHCQLERSDQNCLYLVINSNSNNWYLLLLLLKLWVHDTEICWCRTAYNVFFIIDCRHHCLNEVWHRRSSPRWFNPYVDMQKRRSFGVFPSSV